MKLQQFFEKIKKRLKKKPEALNYFDELLGIFVKELTTLEYLPKFENVPTDLGADIIRAVDVTLEPKTFLEIYSVLTDLLYKEAKRSCCDALPNGEFKEANQVSAAFWKELKKSFGIETIRIRIVKSPKR